MKKRLLVSLSAAAVLSVSSVALVNNNVENTPTVVQAATYKKKLTKNAYIYNAKGKRVGKKVLKKGKLVKILGRKTIKGKKYYKIGKNKYVRTANNGFTKSSTKGEFPTSNSVHAKTSTSSTTSKSSSSSKSSGINTNSDDSGVRYNTKKSSLVDGPMTAESEKLARKKMNVYVYFTDTEVQQIEDRLWQDIQNYRVSKGYPAFKTSSELTNLAQQAQIPGTREFSRFSDTISQNINEIRAYLPGLTKLGMDQAVGYVDSTIYGLNHKGFVIGGDFTHKGWKPVQVADKLFDMMKNSEGIEPRVLYGWKKHNAYAALSMHYYWDGEGSSVGISFFTADGTSPEWVSAWNNAN